MTFHSRRHVGRSDGPPPVLVVFRESSGSAKRREPFAPWGFGCLGSECLRRGSVSRTSPTAGGGARCLGRHHRGFEAAGRRLAGQRPKAGTATSQRPRVGIITSSDAAVIEIFAARREAAFAQRARPARWLLWLPAAGLACCIAQQMLLTRRSGSTRRRPPKTFPLWRGVGWPHAWLISVPR